MRHFPRRSGILLHPTSLPGPFGIGDLGTAAYDFVNFLAASGQYYWQILPISPTGYGDSPYQGLSAFAGNPMLISPHKLFEQGFLSKTDIENLPQFPVDRVDFGMVIPFKKTLLNQAFSHFKSCHSRDQESAFQHFCGEQSSWLENFSLFMALKEANHLSAWQSWEPAIARHEAHAVTYWTALLSEQIENQKFQQWQFFQQWNALKCYASENHIQIIGDIPIFVSGDSADVWANHNIFHLDETLHPTCVAGVPPDYFSETGQLWGNPLYRWDVMKHDNYRWWIERIKHALSLVDLLRIDHFRAFHNYWEVPGGETTAINGRWRPGPGRDFFLAVTHALGDVALIAEDLGDFDSESRSALDALQAEFGFPGMKVLQFAFEGRVGDSFLPYRFSPNCVVYTGTHDNDTITGWYTHSSSKRERQQALKYLGTDGSDIAWDLIRLGWSSVANTAITTAQDLLSLGNEARMNTPATSGPPNWCWRLSPRALNDSISARLFELTSIYGRISTP